VRKSQTPVSQLLWNCTDPEEPLENFERLFLIGGELTSFIRQGGKPNHLTVGDKVISD
jgi:hypothetical protein